MIFEDFIEEGPRATRKSSSKRPKLALKARDVNAVSGQTAKKRRDQSKSASMTIEKRPVTVLVEEIVDEHSSKNDSKHPAPASIKKKKEKSTRKAKKPVLEAEVAVEEMPPANGTLMEDDFSIGWDGVTDVMEESWFQGAQQVLDTEGIKSQRKKDASRSHNQFHKYVTTMRSQLQDWETRLVEWKEHQQQKINKQLERTQARSDAIQKYAQECHVAIERKAESLRVEDDRLANLKKNLLEQQEKLEDREQVVGTNLAKIKDREDQLFQLLASKKNSLDAREMSVRENERVLKSLQMLTQSWMLHGAADFTDAKGQINPSKVENALAAMKVTWEKKLEEISHLKAQLTEHTSTIDSLMEEQHVMMRSVKALEKKLAFRQRESEAQVKAHAEETGNLHDIISDLRAAQHTTQVEETNKDRQALLGVLDDLRVEHSTQRQEIERLTDRCAELTEAHRINTLSDHMHQDVLGALNTEFELNEAQSSLFAQLQEHQAEVKVTSNGLAAQQQALMQREDQLDVREAQLREREQILASTPRMVVKNENTLAVNSLMAAKAQLEEREASVARREAQIAQTQLKANQELEMNAKRQQDELTARKAQQLDEIELAQNIAHEEIAQRNAELEDRRTTMDAANAQAEAELQALEADLLHKYEKLEQQLFAEHSAHVSNKAAAAALSNDEMEQALHRVSEAKNQEIAALQQQLDTQRRETQTWKANAEQARAEGKHAEAEARKEAIEMASARLQLQVAEKRVKEMENTLALMNETNTQTIKSLTEQLHAEQLRAETEISSKEMTTKTALATSSLQLEEMERRAVNAEQQLASTTLAHEKQVNALNAQLVNVQAQVQTLLNQQETSRVNAEGAAKAAEQALTSVQEACAAEVRTMKEQLVHQQTNAEANSGNDKALVQSLQATLAARDEEYQQSTKLLEEKAANATNLLSALHTKIEKLENEDLIGSLKKQIEALEEENTNALERSFDDDKARQDLQAAKVALEAKLQTVTEKFETAVTQHEHVVACMVSDADKQQDALRAKLTARIQELETEQAQSIRIDEHTEKLSVVRNALHAKIEELVSQMAAAAAEHEQTQVMHRDVTAQLESAAEQHKQHQRQSLLKEREMYEQIKQAEAAHTAELEATIASSKKEISSLKSRVETLQAETAQIDAKEAAMAAQTAELAEVKSRLQEQSFALKHAEEECVAEKSRVQELQEQQKKHKHELLVFENQLAAERERVEEAERTAAAKEKHLQTYLASFGAGSFGDKKLLSASNDSTTRNPLQASSVSSSQSGDEGLFSVHGSNAIGQMFNWSDTSATEDPLAHEQNAAPTGSELAMARLMNPLALLASPDNSREDSGNFLDYLTQPQIFENGEDGLEDLLNDPNYMDNFSLSAF